MKILSIRQPWAWLIVHGFKDIENRSWSTKYRGEFLIHAGLQVDREMCDLLRSWSTGADDETGFLSPTHPQLVRLAKEFPKFDDLPIGGIVGRSMLADCVTESSSIWFQGKYGFVLQDSQPLAFQSMRGKLGFFEAAA